MAEDEAGRGAGTIKLFKLVLPNGEDTSTGGEMPRLRVWVSFQTDRLRPLVGA